MSWSSRRQLIYGGIVIFLLLLAIGIPIYLKYFNNPATCFDGIMNQNERGPDCSGVCSRACVDEVIAEPLVRWSRIFPVAGSIYNLVTYAQNPNVTHVGEPVEFVFKVFDKNNSMIDRVIDRIAIPPTDNFAIFVQGFDAKERVPDHVTFEFSNDIVWLKYAGEKAELSISDKNLTNEDSLPRLEVVISNQTVKTYKNIEVIAILYDSAGNAIDASRTYVPALSDHQSKKITFTWATPFDRDVARIEIIPKVPFETHR
jgi:hypothetical protein